MQPAEAHAAMPQQQEAATDAPQAAGVADFWFMDDGQVYTRPVVTTNFLQHLDAKLELRGCTRATGENRKSVARLLAPKDAPDDGEWCTECISNSCKTPGADSAPIISRAPTRTGAEAE